jgi:hypothetical protein
MNNFNVKIQLFWDVTLYTVQVIPSVLKDESAFTFGVKQFTFLPLLELKMKAPRFIKMLGIYLPNNTVPHPGRLRSLGMLV